MAPGHSSPERERWASSAITRSSRGFMARLGRAIALFAGIQLMTVPRRRQHRHAVGIVFLADSKSGSRSLESLSPSAFCALGK